MNQPVLLPYDVPRNLDQDAWFLYETSSLAYYELCARLCEEFAHFFNRLVTGHSAHGMGRVDYWVSRYLTHAENIRRGITFIKQAGDYMPMHDFLRSPAADFRGLIENAVGFEVREEWQPVFERLNWACGTGAATLANNEWGGSEWLNRGGLGSDRVLLDRDDSHTGDSSVNIGYMVERGLLTPPSAFPHHVVDPKITCKPGERCSRSGVWVPQQWLEGARDFSVAFAIEGRPMQPAFHIIGLKPSATFEDLTFPVTRAEDTAWHFVHKAEVARDDARVERQAVGLRVESGTACPREGFWFTPASPNSRRRFTAGELMPKVDSDYGATVWQWDDAP